ncbi:MAG: Spy/CpxP family protein refolding chaperone [Pseudodesulfovibrio sp.]
MKKCTNKCWMLIISGVLILVLATAGFAVSGFKGHFGRQHAKGFVKEKVLSHMDYTVQELKLTPAQQVKYNAIRDKMSTDMDKSSTRHETMKTAMHAEMEKANPDLKSLAGTLKKEIKTMPDVVTTQIDYMVEVYDILDAGQKKKLTTMLKEHMDKKNCS